MATAKTFSPRPQHIERRWYVVDAQGAVLGRLAAEVAKVLRGKHKPIFAPHVDAGDHVIVVNARGVRLTGGKEEKKVYYRHSGFPGGLRSTGYDRLLAERPALAVEKAVRGMLPKNRLGRQMLKKLTVYEGGEHPHEAQKPQPLALGDVPKWEGLPAPRPKPAPKRTARPAEAQTDTGKAAAPAGGGRAREGGRRSPSAGAAAGAAPATRRGAGRKAGAPRGGETKPGTRKSPAKGETT